MEELFLNDMDTTMEKVVKQIYASCDSDNCDLVPVSTLIEFVSPYMSDNLSELQELKLKLDPDDKDPKISSQVFYKAMNEWTNKLKENEMENSFTEIDPNKLSLPIKDHDIPFTQSTPRSSLGYYQIVKNCSGILNTSLSYENSNNNTVFSNKSTYEEQIKELQHQIKKITHELELAREQLEMAEEQNESLLADFNQVKKDLQSEQDLNERLKREKQNVEDIKDEVNSLKKKCLQLEVDLNNSKKEQQHLINEIDQLENYKSSLEIKLENLRKSEDDAKKEIREMQNIIDGKNTEISTLKKVSDELKYLLYEKSELIAFQSNEIQSLKNSTFLLEKEFSKKCLEYNELSESTESLNKNKKGNLLWQAVLKSSTPNQNENKLPLMSETLSPVDVNSPPVMYVVDRSEEQPPSFPDGTGDAENSSKYQNNVPNPKTLKDELCEYASGDANTINYKEIIREKDDVIANLQDIHITCEDLKKELDKKTAIIEKFKQIIDNLSEKIINQFTTFNFSIDDAFPEKKLEKLIDLMVQSLTANTKNRKNFRLQEIKFEKLQEKHDNLQEKCHHLQKINQGIVNENAELKNSIKKYENEIEHIVSEHEKYIKKCETEKIKMQEVYTEDLQFLEDEKKVQKDEIDEMADVILRLRDENQGFVEQINILSKQMQNLHNELVIEKAKKMENTPEINMNLSITNDKGVFRQVNAKTETAVGKIEEKWSFLSYLMSFFWRKSNKMSSNDRPVNCITNGSTTGFIGMFSSKLFLLVLYCMLFVAFLLFYVQFLCVTETRSHSCPLDWFFEYFVTYHINTDHV